MSEIRMPQFVEAVITRMKVAGTLYFSAEQLESLRCDWSHHVGFLADSMVFQFKMHVYTEDLYDKTFDVSVETPATWWQHLKEDLFPSWLKARFPVRYKQTMKTIRQRAFEAYPKLKIGHPNEPSFRHVIMSEVK